MARHTSIDCYDKRGKRGYLFVIGDELAYPWVKPAEVARVLGQRIERPVRVEDILAEVRRRYDTYFILPQGSSYAGDPMVIGFWQDLLGQQLIQLDDLDAVCETIALTVGLGEGAIDLDAGLTDLREVGSGAAATVSKALAIRGTGPGGTARR
jgi:hypothetical protein